ncbi:ATP-binding protein [Bdellovibrionota bacterium FG-1]
MKRKPLQSLHNWKQKPSRTPILLRGARQVGKTWLAREFGKSFEHFVEINLEVETDLHSLFDKFMGDPASLIKNLSLHKKGIEITPDKTLLFLDEVQECESALKALRYFKEKLPELHVLATGSLLEFQLKELGVPVGRVEFQWILPMNFEEFLWAQGLQTEFDPTVDVEAVYQKHLTTYLNIGGLPEVVDVWCKTESLAQCQGVLQRLAASYRADFSRYASRSLIEPLRIVFEQTPRYWGQKIKYSSLSPQYRSRELESAIELLGDAGLVTRCILSSANGVPLSAEMKPQHFKLFSVDLGLGQRLLNLDLQGQPWNECLNRGGLIEQFVAQEIRSCAPINVDPELFFWHREKKTAKAELDFVLSAGTHVIPVEVKAGMGGHHPSLNLFIHEKKPEMALLVSTSETFDFPIKKASKVIHRVPVWRLFQILQLLQTQKSSRSHQ